MFEIEPDLLQDFFLRLEFHDRLVMAMPLNDGFLLQPRNPERLAFALNEFAERHRRFAEAKSVFVAREEAVQLVAKDGEAARLESDDRRAAIELRPKLVHHFDQQFFRGVEKSPVVQRPTATERLFRDDDVISGAAKHFSCRN